MNSKMTDVVGLQSSQFDTFGLMMFTRGFYLYIFSANYYTHNKQAMYFITFV